MKKSGYFLLPLFCLLGSLQLQAQDGSAVTHRPSVKVNGSALLRVVPDQAVINIAVKAIEMDVNKAMSSLETHSGKLSEKLREAGFRNDEIKTSQVNVQANGRWRNGEYIDSGYVAMQHIQLKFKRDQERIARLLNVFSQEDGAEALFQFGFTLSDEAQKEAGQELIRKAVEDARDKAATIATASGVKLGKIRNIVYGQPEYRPMLMQAEMMDMKARGGQQQNFAEMEAREIELQDTIIVYWDLEE